ncbi:hypothetical protein D3C73_1415620 [compost metagenome]
MFHGAEVHHCRAEEAPLDASLDLQRRVGGDDLFEAGDVAAVVVGAAQPGGEGAMDGVVVHQELQLLEHSGTVLGVVQALDFLDRRVACHRAGLVPDVGPPAQELLSQGSDIHHRLGSAGRGCVVAA